MSELGLAFAWTVLKLVLTLLAVLVPFGILDGLNEVYGGRKDF